MTNNKKKITNIILLISILISSMMIITTTKAIDAETYPFLTVVPGTVGVGQTLHLSFWLSNPPPTILELGPGDLQGWEGLTIEVTKPDGTTDNLGPFKTDSTGGTYTSYIPNQIGNYDFQMSFPGQWKNGTELYTLVFEGRIMVIADYFKPSTSKKVAVVVQEDPIASYPDLPLPDKNQYWERPIEIENRDWWSISGNWLLERYNATGAFNPYTTAPNTAHIVWTKELAFGGVTGGEFGTESYNEGHLYSNKFTPPVIINGRLYYNQPDPPKQGFYCVDLHTGEQIFYSNTSSNPTGTYQFWSHVGGTGGITAGQLINFDSINEHGLHAYLWNLGPKFTLYDPFTGNAILDFENVHPLAQYGGELASTAAVSFDKKGNLLVYAIDGVNNWLLMWNSSKALAPTVSGLAHLPNSGTYDWNAGIEWNMTIPDLEGKQVFLGFSEPAAINDEVLLVTTAQFFTADRDGKITHAAYSAKDGSQLWYQNRTYPAGTTSFNRKGPIMNGIYCIFIKDTLQWYGYDIYTGELVWGPSEAYTNAWGMYGGGSATAAYGNLYASAFDGMIHAYDIANGDHLWDYSTGDAGYESPYGTWPFYGLSSALTIADGKLYQGTGEHSADVPMWRGGGLHCVDAYSGDLLWKIKGWFWTPVIADGYMVTNNGADNRIYCFGKGQTKTTVSGPLTVITEGESLMLTGTVNDQSPGAMDTPAIADEYMTEWMEYLYMQNPMPMNVQGVEVLLETVDPNGNFYEIGTVTSDASGMFKLMWQPPVPGEYTVIATFLGSDSYFGSHAETALGVVAAPEPTAPPEATPAPMTDTYIAGSTIAILAGIAVAVFLILRKK